MDQSEERTWDYIRDVLGFTKKIDQSLSNSTMPRGPIRSLYVELGTTDYECREENNNVIRAVTFFCRR